MNLYPESEDLVAVLVALVYPLCFFLVLFLIYRISHSKGLLKRFAVLVIILWIVVNAFFGPWRIP